MSAHHKAGRVSRRGSCWTRVGLADQGQRDAADLLGGVPLRSRSAEEHPPRDKAGRVSVLIGGKLSELPAGRTRCGCGGSSGSRRGEEVRAGKGREGRGEPPRPARCGIYAWTASRSEPLPSKSGVWRSGLVSACLRFESRTRTCLRKSAQQMETAVERPVAGFDEVALLRSTAG